MTDHVAPELTGPRVLLEGPTGTGKTYAIGTLVDWAAKQNPPVEVFVLFTENGLETLLGYWKDPKPGKPARPVPANLHYHTVLTKPISLKALMKTADDVGKYNFELISKMQDNDRSGNNNAFHKILTACNDFPDDRTGKKFGAVDSWGVDKIFCMDSLSETANACMKMVIGSKPTASKPDYGVAQNNLMNFLRLCTQGLACTFVMTAHIKRETDEITGGVKLMTSAIGAAISGEIPKLFSDTILTVREGDKWYWDTANANTDVKTRSLPIASKIAPDFGIIMDVWKSRGLTQ